VLTVSAVAKRLGLKEPTIRLWISQGRIAHLKLGRAIRVPAEEVERIIRESLRAAVK
jgi:excisionase family DNA binding protein